MYLLAVDAQIRAMSNGTRSVDDVVLTLLARRQTGGPHGVNDFLGLVSDALGPGVEKLAITLTMRWPLARNSLCRQWRTRTLLASL
jgi:hypothetical protein